MKHLERKHLLFLFLGSDLLFHSILLSYPAIWPPLILCTFSCGNRHHRVVSWSRISVFSLLFHFPLSLSMGPPWAKVPIRNLCSTARNLLPLLTLEFPLLLLLCSIFSLPCGILQPFLYPLSYPWPLGPTTACTRDRRTGWHQVCPAWSNTGLTSEGLKLSPQPVPGNSQPVQIKAKAF